MQYSLTDITTKEKFTFDSYDEWYEKSLEMYYIGNFEVEDDNGNTVASYNDDKGFIRYGGVNKTYKNETTYKKSFKAVFEND